MRIFIADADAGTRLALQMYLHREPGLYVTGMASQSQGLVTQVKASQPDVLLLDWKLPGAFMQDLLAEILRLNKPPKVVVLSADPDVKSTVMSAGADAFVSQNGPPDKLLEVLYSMKNAQMLSGRNK
ncbi:MAG: response regulator transcription factor [Anaerolineaceae bacterium]|nr:MAG: response regulator transcription factor [Anaerolineaceae bacterium]